MTKEAVFMVVCLLASVIFALIALMKVYEQEGVRSKYMQLMEKGQMKLIEASLNTGTAEAYYDEATKNYQYNRFEVCKSYAANCKTYYFYGQSDFDEAKELFDRAQDYKLAELYSKWSGCLSNVSAEMHDACEYFSMACDHYSQNDIKTGDWAIEKANKHIGEHDRLVPICNAYIAKIKTLLE
jgi:hypothetical protein